MVLSHIDNLEDACLEEVTEWMYENIFICSLEQIGIDTDTVNDLRDEMNYLPFIYNHVGGLGTNTPRRGVCVVGNQTLRKKDQESIIVDTTSWTSSQNKSNCILVSKTAKMPDNMNLIIPNLIAITEDIFPNVPISTSTYALLVANEYLPGHKHTISPHTDDQPWYADPPVFASVTFFPDGRPSHPNATYRFQILDESDNTWKNVFLDDATVCIMRADVTHRVLPPLVKYKNQTKRRLNATYRNLSDPNKDPLGFQMAMANHYRYYGIPLEIRIPSDVQPPLELIKRYQNLNPNIKINILPQTKGQRRENHKKLKIELEKQYKYKFPSKMASKTNVVLETTEKALKMLNV